MHHNTNERRGPSGLRRVSPASLEASRAARGHRTGRDVTRLAVLQAAKGAGPALGLKGVKLTVLDALFAFTRAQDWVDGARPVVWPSNTELAARVGLAVSTLRYHLAALCQAGYIAYSDGPTYQRRGRRDAGGNIVEANGIDLSPMAARYHELVEIKEAFDRERAERRALSYRRTVLRREVEASLEAARVRGLVGPWDRFRADLDRLLGEKAMTLEELMDQVEALRGLSLAVDEAFLSAAQDDEADPLSCSDSSTADAKYQQLQTTAQNQPVSCNDQQRRSKDRQPACGASGAMAFETKPAAATPGRQATTVEGQTGDRAPASVDDDIAKISLPLVRQACPDLADLLPDAFASWSALRGSGPQLCRLASINAQVWQEAHERLGPDLAIAALAVTVQRSWSGEVQSAGAYLRRLVQRGGTGELFISRSLFAMAKAGTGGSQTEYRQ